MRGEREKERESGELISRFFRFSHPGSPYLSPPPPPPHLFLKKKKKNSPHQLLQKAAVIATVRTAVTLDRDDPAREAAVAAVRQATNTWVAKYRRDNQFSGKPSYG